MPLYDFQCRVCETVVELNQAHSAPPPDCEKCGPGDDKMVRLIGRPAPPIFKGGSKATASMKIRGKGD